MDEKTIARFWSKVDKSGGPDACWPWTEGTTSDGYGQLGVGSRTDGSKTTLLAHRIAYQLKHGAIPDGLFVCHDCDNPPCCNADHLFLGTQRDNIRDAAEKGRRAIGERHPQAKLTDTEVRAIRAALGTQREIAARYGVSHATVGMIQRGEIWAHVS